MGEAMGATVFTAGQDVDAWCGRCKAVFAHVIHAVVSGVPARVECKTCRAEHAFKPTKPQPGRGTTTRRATAARRSVEDANRRAYEKARRGRGEDVARPYSIRDLFAYDDLILHSKFGLIVVVQLLGDGKFTASTPDGPITLVHGR